MIVSASQIKTFAGPQAGTRFGGCPRLWWLEKVQRLERFRGESFGTGFGTILHAVNERWLLADDSGRDPRSGRPVEIYPEGWHICAEDRVVLTEEEQELVKELVAEAIAEGILVRHPGRKIEHDFVRMLAPNVAIRGYIDVLLPAEVQDHKTTKSMRYALSKEKLAKDRQVLIYAKNLTDPLTGEDPVDEVRLTHNVFERSGRLRQTSVVVPREEVEKNWKECEDIAQEMVALKGKRLPLVRWDEVEGADSSDRLDPDRCAAYGGCSYFSICSRRETHREFEERQRRLKMDDLIARARAARKAQQAKKKEEETEPNTDSSPTTGSVPATSPAPSRSLIVLEGAHLVKGQVSDRDISSRDLLRRVLEADDVTWEGYFAKDVWARREALEAMATAHLPGMLPLTVTFDRPSPDEAVLLGPCRDLASQVIKGGLA